MRKNLIAIIFVSIIILFSACKDASMNKETGIAFYVGTYTDGDSEGIYEYELLRDGSLKQRGLRATTENPSFLFKSNDGKFLLAVNEVMNEDGVGFVSSFRIEEDSMAFINKVSSGGGHPCHITMNAENFIVVSNYSGGNMGLIQLESDGQLSDLLDVQQHSGKGIHDRQDGPHAHSGWFTKDGSLVSVDLGTNQLWFSRIDSATKKFVPMEPANFTMDEGAGPRHLAFHPEKQWIYVVNELSSSVALLKRNAESGLHEIVQTISTLPEGFESFNSCADIHISSDGKYVYASNRGHNSIVIFSVNERTGELQLTGHVATEGKTPRNFALSPKEDFLLVANQDSHNIVSFKRNPATGLLSLVDEISAPKPVCILF